MRLMQFKQTRQEPIIGGRLLAVVVVSLFCLSSLAVEAGKAPVGADAAARLRALGPQGIVVPKRSALIMGLNQQFRLRADKTSSSGRPTSATGGQPQMASGPIMNVSSQLAGAADMDQQAGPLPTSSSHPAKGLFAPINWLASRAQSSQQRRQQQQQQQPPPPPVVQSSQQQQAPSPQQQQQVQPAAPTQALQTLYLDRYQQQLLAANPALLNPESQTNLTNLALLTRSDGAHGGLDPHLASHPMFANHFSANMTHNRLSSAAGQTLSPAAEGGQSSQQQQQLYRGYSLIELEVKSESDRRYVQDLYGNLSAALNEQAANPNSPTVSPYVDVDFWSLEYGGLNDRIDIMVSPKSRAFILSQLLRSRIRHRIKIDDIQARLDQQQQQQQQQSGAVSGAQAVNDNQQASAGYLHAKGKMAPDSPLIGRATQSEQQQPPQRLAPRQAPDSPPVGSAMNDTMFFDNYQRVADINQWLESLVERNREVARVKVIGRSSQGRYLRVLKLGYDQQSGAGGGGGNWDPPSQNDRELDLGIEAGRQPSALDNASYILDAFFKRQASAKHLGSIWLDGGTHAREWISPATVLFIAHRLANNHNKCQHFFDMLTQLVAVGKQSTSLVELELSATSGRRESRRYNLNNATSDHDDTSLHHLHLSSPVAANLQPIKPPPLASNLDPSILPSINEINTSLLGKPVAQARQRTELERTMEQLAKNPRELAAAHNCDLELDQLLRRYTFYMMPVLNPDGYEYSHTHNRLWRKTRSTSNHPIYRHFCLGADPNRNYDARHGSTGSSTHPCSQTYAGAVPFTEPETKHQSNFVYANRLDMKMFISFHSYSQMILLPFSHSKQLAPDHKDLESVGMAAVKAIERTYGTTYRVGPSASILYTASGTASDWAYEKVGIKYSYTIELRDTGAYGFLLPRQQIVPTGEETFNGLLAMIDQMEKNDNLLTSKSGNNNQQHHHQATNAQPSAFPEVVATMSPAGSGSGEQMATPVHSPASPLAVDTSHVPDTDYLKPLSSQSQRPPLENILDTGVGSWSAAEHALVGVRDRRPPPGQGAATGEMQGADANELQHAPRDEENTGIDSEPDSGYAFEGEGELMEPTRDNILEAARMASDMRVSGRRDHSRRIVQTAGLTSSGRSLINSPLLSIQAHS